MTTRLIVADTSVYEIDEDCLKQKKEKEARNKKETVFSEQAASLEKGKKEPAF